VVNVSTSSRVERKRDNIQEETLDPTVSALTPGAMMVGAVPTWNPTPKTSEILLSSHEIAPMSTKLAIGPLVLDALRGAAPPGD